MKESSVEWIRDKRLKKLYELSMTLSGDPSDVFKHVACMIGELFEIRVVCLSEIRGDELYFISVYVDGEVMVDAGHCPLSITPCATVEEAKDIRVYDYVAERFPEASFLKQHNAYAYCGFPVLDVSGNVVAVTCLLDDKPHDFSEEDKELLRIFGQRIAMELERQAHLAEKMQMEDELFKMRKLESLGVLAGGIAHDFNNFLTGILGNISLAQLYTKPGDQIHHILVDAVHASLKARDLTRQLLTFAKGGAPIKKIASIVDLIKDSAGFALKGSNVRCDFSIPSNLKPVEVDETQMSQVIHNLIINAHQAVPEGGSITVSAENLVLSGEKNLPLKAGEYVKIVVADKGEGISVKDLPMIFDPYFTTKTEGSGLGLATTYSIVQRHHGQIHVESEVGVGTTFTVYLPASNKEITTIKEETDQPVTGQGRILLMDDEEIVRKVAGRILQNAGYEIEFAEDGVDAIETYREARDKGLPFDVVIMDLTIPGGMGGKEAVQKLTEIDPEAKVVVSSGYSNDPIMANYSEYGFKAGVAKPYKTKELISAISTAISA